MKREIDLQKNRISRLRFFKGGFVLAGITFVLGLVWGFVSPFTMVGMLAYAVFGAGAEIGLFSLPSALGVYFAIFLYGSLINFVAIKRSTSNNKLVRAILFVLVFLLVVFYLLVLFLGFLGNG